MSAPKRTRFPSRKRLRGAAAFGRVLRSGRRVDGPLFVLVAAPGAERFDRVGLVTSRKLGGAVARNRARRVLRESFRSEPRNGPPLDLILIAKPEIIARGGDEVRREYRRRLEALAAARGPRRARPLGAD